MPIYDSSDSQLLARWLNHRCEVAFRELVARYSGLVHAAARRTSGDETLAAEAAQATFILLARMAGSLVGRRSLGGWLHQTAMLQTRNLQRQHARETRKRQALQAAMEPPNPSHDDTWQGLQPVLDDALTSLNAADREALLLRFYRAMSIGEVAATLGIASEAARKRIDRALDRLRGKLARRGVTSGVSLGAVLLAGFARDAQAASLMVPALSANALAAGGASAAAVPMSLAAKVACAALPASVLLGGGIWLAAQAREIAGLEGSNLRVSNQLEAAIARSGVTDRPAAKPTALDRRPVDWAEVVRQLRNGLSVGNMTGGFAFLDTNRRLLDRFDGLTRDALIAHWDDLEAAGLPPDDLDFARGYLTRPLTELDPGYVVKRLLPTFKPGFYESSDLPDLLAKWTLREPREALAWLDSQVATGRIPAASPPFELAVISSLMPYDLDAAAERLALMPMAEQIPLWEFNFGRNWGVREKQVWQERDLAAAFAKLARVLPEKDHLNALAWILIETGETDRNGVVGAIQASLPDFGRSVPAIREFFERIQATPAERRACIETLIKHDKHSKEELLAEFPDALR